VRGFRLRWLAVLLAVIAGSQLGHTFVYLARYGVEAGRYESIGIHTYYPTLSAVVGAVLGVTVAVGLLLVAAAQVLYTPPGFRLRRSVHYLDILAAVFVLQLLTFVVQESVEAWVAGYQAPSIGETLLWGTLGQLPAAAIAAALIAWLLSRVEEAWTSIVRGCPRLVVQPSTPALADAAWPDPDLRVRLGSACPSAFRKRGPPQRPVLT
jgi:hypothetical protein